MKVYVALAALAIAVFSGPVEIKTVAKNDDGSKMEYFLVETSDGEYEVEDLVNAEINPRVSESDIIYHFFSQNNPTEGITLKSDQVGVLKNTQFNRRKDTVFVVHGWKDQNDSTYNVQMRETVLSKHDINVFVVDWATIALRNYISARYSVVEVGEHIADFIKSLVSTYRLDLSRVYFVGHSLGAHISGNAGAALGGKVGNIVGLDPAGPLFSVDNIDDRLDPTDALFVQAIHTNGGLLGFRQSLGHADYFPNGGSSQPGCILDIAGTCAHARSYIYYAESILSENNFKATLCSSYLLYKLNWCGSNTNPLSQMAGYSIDTRASGDYYLDTNSNPPYAKN